MSSFPARSRRARVTALTLGLVAALGLSACGNNDDKPAASGDAGSGSSQSADPGPQQLYWPLTGAPMQKVPKHPPVAVKIDNTVASRPQVGLGTADLITEELVEGGLTRLAVFFDTKIPKLVGPVRSMRASDIGLVKPVKGVVVTSGAASPTIARLKAAKVDFRSNDGGASGFYRDNSRHAPYNLMNRLPDLVKSLKNPTSIGKPYLPWGPETGFKPSGPATDITARFGSGHTTLWKFENGTYTNTNSNASAGDQFKPSTVVVVRVQTKDAGYTDPAGNPVPESVTTGTGNATVFHNGQVQEGTWSKGDAAKPWKFSDASGQPMTIPAGHTWVEVLPVDAKGGSLVFK